MNYRHHFHAGNFADVMKHALWLELLAKLAGEPRAIQVIDTHAGAGLYDLNDALARRSGEADAGIGRLMKDDAPPPVFSRLKAAVRAENPDGPVRFYPGSPLLSLHGLRRGDCYLGCELRADDQATLQALLNAKGGARSPDARAILADGYAQVGDISVDDGFRRVVLIDPPFERGDEYEQIVSGVRRASAKSQTAFAIWAPIKDLETFDALLRSLEALNPASVLVAEARLRPLHDPMRMNGSAMIFLGAPDLEIEAQAVCDWVVKACGEPGGEARVRKLGL